MTVRKELWKTTYLDPNEPTMFTLESFALYHNLPGPTRPENVLSLTKILISRGFADRGTYWSKKAIYKPRKKVPLPKPLVPSYIRIPRGVFSSKDLLHLNNMPLRPENYDWAKKYLDKCPKTQRVPGSWRYMSKNPRTGKLPSTFTGNWELPNPHAFTTYQFQVHNEVYGTNITSEQWGTAVEFLTREGFQFDTSWKRWRKS